MLVPTAQVDSPTNKGFRGNRSVNTLLTLLSRRTRAERQKPFWERAYKGHGYWLGQTRLGHVEVSPGQLLEMKYQWRAGTHAGQATSLRDAKRLVEQTVLLGGRQLTLFSDDFPTRLTTR